MQWLWNGSFLKTFLFCLVAACWVFTWRGSCGARCCSSCPSHPAAAPADFRRASSNATSEDETPTHCVCWSTAQIQNQCMNNNDECSAQIFIHRDIRCLKTAAGKQPPNWVLYQSWNQKTDYFNIKYDPSVSSHGNTTHTFTHTAAQPQSTEMWLTFFLSLPLPSFQIQKIFSTPRKLNITQKSVKPFHRCSKNFCIQPHLGENICLYVWFGAYSCTPGRCLCLQNVPQHASKPEQLIIVKGKKLQT